MAFEPEFLEQTVIQLNRRDTALLSRVTPLVDKAFGSLCYDWDLSRYSRNYCVRTLTESIIETER